jgi:hypothetical protein
MPHAIYSMCLLTLTRTDTSPDLSPVPCFNPPPPPPPPPPGSDSRSSLAVVGAVSGKLQLLQLPGLSHVADTPGVTEGLIPQSVALADFEGVSYMLCGLGAGELHTWRLDNDSHTLAGASMGWGRALGGGGGGRGEANIDALIS